PRGQREVRMLPGGLQGQLLIHVPASDVCFQGERGSRRAPPSLGNDTVSELPTERAATVSSPTLLEPQTPPAAPGAGGDAAPARRVLKETLKRLARAAALLLVSPLWLCFRLQAALIGRDQALEYASEVLGLVPGLSGRYMRRAFLSCVLESCHPTA